ncbi:hypothetical protein SAMN02910358_00718 [Lachnospiraceae bacterium XBB1006]|nr:hypothetical protein SAMN02910358_00718 [Lachnospiraceae bacterium XBB1006]
MGLFDGLGALFLGAAVIDGIKTKHIKSFLVGTFENQELYDADLHRLCSCIRQLEKCHQIV